MAITTQQAIKLVGSLALLMTQQQPLHSIERANSNSWIQLYMSNRLTFMVTKTILTMPATAAKYQYEPLDPSSDSVRLLQVLPPGPEGLINCSLTNSYLTEARYNALSYMWDPNRPEYELKNVVADKALILLDGVQYEVGRNLWQFLRVVQLRRSRVYLWIDALCIDQNNVEERNRQVRMMGTIYSKANLVLLWLGPGSDATAAFFGLLNSIQSGGGRDIYSNTWNHGVPVIAQQADDLLRQTITGYHEVSTNQYWHRAWILQEVALAKEVIIMCGSIQMSWDPFRSSLMSLFKELSPTYDPLFGQIGLQRYTRLDRKAAYEVLQCRSKQYRQKDNLCSIVRMNFSRQCKHVQDRIYSLLSLASDGHIVIVDYNWTPIQLWEHVVTAIGNGIFRYGVYLLNTLEASAEDVLETASQQFLGHRLRIDLVPREIQSICHSDDKPARSYWNNLKTAYVTETELYLCSCISCKDNAISLSEDDMVVRLPGGTIKLLFGKKGVSESSLDATYEPKACVKELMEKDFDSDEPDAVIVALNPHLMSEIQGLSLGVTRSGKICSDLGEKKLGLALSLTRRDLINIWKHRHYHWDLLSDPLNGFGEWKHDVRIEVSAKVCFFAVYSDYGKSYHNNWFMDENTTADNRHIKK